MCRRAKTLETEKGEVFFVEERKAEKKWSVRVTEGSSNIVVARCQKWEIVRSGFMYQVVPPLHKQH